MNSVLLDLYMRKRLAEEALRPFQEQLRDNAPRDMTDTDFDEWKADVWRNWTACIDAQRNYERAVATVQKEKSS